MANRARFCPSCGQPIDPAGRFCGACGHPVPATPPAASEVPPPPPPIAPPPVRPTPVGPPPPRAIAAPAAPAAPARRRVLPRVLLILIGLAFLYGLADVFVMPREYSLTRTFLADLIPTGGGSGGGPQRAVTAVAFSPDGRLLGAATEAGHIFLWDVSSGRRELQFPLVTGRIDSLALSHDGRHVAAGAPDGIMTVLWDPRLPADSRILAATPLSGAAGTRAMCLLYQPTDQVLVALDPSVGAIRFWDTTGGGQLQPMGWFPPPLTLSAALSPDHRFLAEGTGDSGLMVTDLLMQTRAAVLRVVPAGKVIAVTPGPGGLAVAGAVLPDSGPVSIGVWTLRHGARQALDAPSDVFALAFSPDGRTVAGGGLGVVYLWDIRSGKVATTFRTD